MDKDRTQSSDKDDFLAEMEALIRNGVRIDVPQAVNKHLEEYEKMAPDEREFDLELWIEDARGRLPCYDSQVAWAFLKELSGRILDRDEVYPRQLAQFSMEALAGRIQEKLTRGRPRRSRRAKFHIVETYNMLIEWKGYTVGKAQRTIADWMDTKPDAVAQIVSDWNRPHPELNSKIIGLI